MGIPQLGDITIEGCKVRLFTNRNWNLPYLVPFPFCNGHQRFCSVAVIFAGTLRALAFLHVSLCVGIW